jgi:hypothetical protein
MLTPHLIIFIYVVKYFMIQNMIHKDNLIHPIKRFELSLMERMDPGTSKGEVT